MTLRNKLLLAQAPLVLALAVLGAVAIGSLSRLGTHSQEILKDNYRSVLAAQRMKESIERIDSAALFVLSGHRSEAEGMIASNRAVFEAELAVQASNITELGEGEATDLLGQRWAEYQGLYGLILGLDGEAQAKDWYFSRLLPVFYAVKGQADVILSMNQDAMVRKSEDVSRFSRRMDAFMLLTTVASALSGVVLSVLLLSRLVRPLSVLSQTARAIGQGDFAVRAKVQGKDEIALLATEFNAMADSLERYRKSSLGELMTAQHTVQSAIDSLPDPIMSFGLDGNLLSLNRAAEENLGMALDQGCSESLAGLEPELRRVVGQARSHVLSGRGAYTPKGFEEAVRVVVAGADCFYLPQAQPIYDDLGSLAGLTVVLRDVGLLRKIDELSANLVATFAHEFRTPLTSLHLAVHVCLEEAAGPLTENQKDLLHAAREDCARLQNMVNDLLDLARIQSGRVQMRLRQVDLCALLDYALDQHRLMAEEKGVALARLTSPACEFIQADPDRLELILANLITNAIRHTPPGGLVELKATEAGDKGVRFEVSDTGEGIPEEYQAQIFEKFFRIPGVSGRGTGLGLAIAKNIVEAHGGTIGVDSEPGQGSTFWFEIPGQVSE